MIGICAPNGEPFGLDWWAEIEPSSVLVMEGQAGYIEAIRQRLPHARVYLRAELGGRAWDPPSSMNAKEYAGLCADLANRYRPDCFIPWNEANIEWRSFGDPSGKEGYVLLRDYARRFVDAYRALSSVPVAFPALSPGHQEDDGIMGGNILTYTANLFDEIHYHDYWTPYETGSHLSEWYGLRSFRKNKAYNPQRPVVITEFNRIFNRNDGSDVENYLKEIREWRLSLPPNVTDALYFIADSPDASFDTMAIKNNRRLVEGLRDINRDRSVMEYYNVDVAIVQPVPVVTPGGVSEVVIKVTKEDGSAPGNGVAIGRLMLPLKSEDPVDTYTSDPVYMPRDELREGMYDTTGDFTLVANIPEFTIDRAFTATLVVDWYGREGTTGFSNTMGHGRGEFPITVGPRGTSTPIPVPAPTPVPVSGSIDPHYLFARLGDVNNRVVQAQKDVQVLVEEMQRYLANFR